MADMLAEAWLLLPALLLEAAIGYPQALYARISHPVVWMGDLIAWLERRWNRSSKSDSTRRLLGVATVVIILCVSTGIGALIEWLASKTTYGWLIVVIAATSGLAQHSLYTHTRDVLTPLLAGDLLQARLAVGRIVGRDTQQLDETGVATAALESLAESFNDAVIAPAFWFAIGGLPGLFAYKAMNTADSMIGHREPRWRMFGWAAARTDDLLNLVPARLAGLLIAIGGLHGFGVMWRDASKHDSPNAGWPEAAMAGALNVRLGGIAVYDGVAHERATFGRGDLPGTRELAAGMRIYLKACGLLWSMTAAIALVHTWSGT
jgi:adenosylcobinamide-phosphate synthase